jgi:hypothetical protein
MSPEELSRKLNAIRDKFAPLMKEALDKQERAERLCKELADLGLEELRFGRYADHLNYIDFACGYRKDLREEALALVAEFFGTLWKRD